MHEASAVIQLPQQVALEQAGLMPPTLFEHFADTELTVFGQTGTLGQLLEMCPVAHDPNIMTPEAIEKFTVKVLESAGVEIPDTFAYLRTEKPPKPDQAQPDKIAKQAAPVAAKKVATPEAKTAKPVVTAAKLPEFMSSPVSPAEVAPILPVAPAVTEAIRAILEPDEPATPPKRPHKPISARKTRVVPQPEVTTAAPVEFLLPTPVEATASSEPVLPKPPVHEMPAVAVVEVAETDAETAMSAVQTAEMSEAGDVTELAEVAAATEAPEASLALPFEDPFEASSPEAATTTPEAEIGELETAYDTFQQALFTLAEALAPAAAALESPLSAEAAEIAPGVVTIPLICKEVAERLIALEPAEKTEAMPIVQNISIAVQEVHELTTTHASTEEIAAAEEHLTELCIELFKTLGIEYDEETVRQFVQSILRPDFVRNIAAAPVLDLEHMGTHEVKRRAGQLPAALSDFLAGSSIHSLLGNLTLTLNSVYVNIA